MTNFKDEKTRLEAGDILIVDKETGTFAIISKDDKKNTYEKRFSTNDNRMYFVCLKNKPHINTFLLILREISGLKFKEIQLSAQTNKLAYKFFE